MNKYYKLLIFFHRNELLSRDYLMHRPGISEDLIDEAIELGFIKEIDRTDDGDCRYIITEAGIERRDK